MPASRGFVIWIAAELIALHSGCRPNAPPSLPATTESAPEQEALALPVEPTVAPKEVTPVPKAADPEILVLTPADLRVNRQNPLVIPKGYIVQ